MATFKEGRSVDYHAEAGRRLRTTNGVERLNKEIKRRTRVATLFPNEASLLRLVPAVLSKISDDWETARSYLAIGSDDEPSLKIAIHGGALRYQEHSEYRFTRWRPGSTVNP